MGSKRFHKKPAPFKPTQIRMSITIHRRDTAHSLRSFAYTSTTRLYPAEIRTETPLDLVAVAAAGLVALLGPDEDGRGGGGGGAPVYKALRARGVPAAAGADRAQLDHLVGLGEEKGHRAEGLAAEVQVQTGGDHLAA